MRIKPFGPKINSFWEYSKFIFINKQWELLRIYTFLFLTSSYLAPFLFFIGWSDQTFEKQLEGFYFGIKTITIGVLIFFGIFAILHILTYFVFKNRTYLFLPDGTIKMEKRKLFLILNKKSEKILKMQGLTFGVINEPQKSFILHFKNKFVHLIFLGHDFAEYDTIIKYIWKFRPDLPISIGQDTTYWSKDRSKYWRKYEIK